MSVSQTGGDDGPAISQKHIDSVRTARGYLARAKQMKFDSAPSMVMLRDLLEAYDALGARLAYLAAILGEKP